MNGRVLKVRRGVSVLQRKRYRARLALMVLGIGGTLPLLAADPYPFPVTPAVSEVTPRERVWDGTVEAINQSTVSAQTSGRVAEIAYDVNDFVPQGAVIVRFTDTEQRAALRRANASLVEAQARLEEAATEFERIETMFGNETVSKARFEQAKANHAAAKARADAALSGVTTAEEQLEYTVIRAPYAGIVAERHIEVGELVRPGQPIMSGLSLQSLRVNVDVPQSMFKPIREIGKAFVYADDQRITAESMTFYPVADPVTNTFTVRVNLPEDSATLFPGMFVKVGFVVGEARRLLVPEKSVVRRSELTAVYVLDGDRATLRQVRLGRRYGERIEILAGITENELVASDPVRAGIYLKEYSATVDRDE
ncbi:MAG: efflux RND transporter periplasmic adaptor subunit [Gammaproteobacteria bacterium]|nr:efflux RND transporter periplasmic adaptor subunit [Gammaproteobacteria bacterium]